MVQEIVLCDDRTRERNMFGDLRTKSPCCQEYENALAPILCTWPCQRHRQFAPAELGRMSKCVIWGIDYVFFTYILYISRMIISNRNSLIIRSLFIIRIKMCNFTVFDIRKMCIFASENNIKMCK